MTTQCTLFRNNSFSPKIAVDSYTTCRPTRLSEDGQQIRPPAENTDCVGRIEKNHGRIDVGRVGPISCNGTRSTGVVLGQGAAQLLDQIKSQSRSRIDFMTLSHLLFAKLVFFAKSYRVVRAIDLAGQPQFNLFGNLKRRIYKLKAIDETQIHTDLVYCPPPTSSR